MNTLRLSITRRTALLSWAITVTTLFIFAGVIVPWQKRTFLNNLDSKARSVAISLREVAAGAAVNEDYSSVIEHCKEMLAADDSLACLVITKNNGFTLIHERSGWRSLSDVAPEWRPARRQISSGIREVSLTRQRAFLYSQPFDYSGLQWGWIHIGLSLDSYNQSVTSLYRLAFGLTLLCLGVSLLGSLGYARHLLRPVLDLRRTVQRVADGDLHARAAADRTDELGDLARSVNDMSAALLRHDRILGSVQFAAQHFVSTANWRAVIAQILAEIGQSVGVSRAFVLEIKAGPAGYPVPVHEYEWRGAGLPARPYPANQPPWPDFSADRAGWAARFRTGETIIASQNKLTPPEVTLMTGRAPRALLMVPVMVEGVWWGLLGLDDANQDRQWRDAERDSLQTTADMLGSAVARQRTQEALLRTTATLEQRVLERTEALQKENTERREAEAALARSHAVLNATLESSLDAIMVIAHDGEVKHFNHRFSEMWGLDPALLTSRRNRAIFAVAAKRVKDPQAYIKRALELHADHRTESIEVVEFKDGRIFERFTSPLYFDGVSTGRVWCFRDITARLQLEQQLRHSQKMEAVGQLAAGIAHDFNNMLTVIQGNASLLISEQRANDPDLPMLQSILGAAQRSAKLVRQLLTFSHKQMMEIKPLRLADLHPLLAEMLPRMLGGHITVEVDLPPGLPVIHADVGMIEQMLMNLAVNARDAMPKGGRLTISAEPVEFSADVLRINSDARPGRFLCLRVSDTGCGIPPDVLPRIFEPFFTTKPIGQGTGLGLATVYAIIRQHDGWIEVSSEPDHGTTFLIYLPPAIASDPVAPALVPAETARTRGHETILLVEDEEAVRASVSRILKSHGYRVIPAHHGAEALAVWARHHPEINLLLTDMVMPEGLSGLELAKRLSADRPDLKVIYTSGYSRDMAKSQAPFPPGHHFLAKPYQAEVLLHTIRECLER
jgi:PAS domain S-box-containing protein